MINRNTFGYTTQNEIFIMLKKSVYSYSFVDEGVCYLYNSQTNLFMQIEEELYRLLYDDNFEAIESSVLERLIKSKFILEEKEQYNYYYEQKTRFLANNYNSKHLSLVIVPTTGCNFSCLYCFEGEKKGKLMSDEMISHLLSFIKGHKNAETLSITWYGGEPLLGFEKIKIILSAIKTETSLKITSQNLVTNGYLLSEKIIDFFAENKLKSMQITIDGIKENHDSTRFLKDKTISTFDKIMENIGKAITHLPDCKTSIRINIKKSNMDDYHQMYRLLYERFPHSKLSVYPGFIREETQDGCRMRYESMIDYDTRYVFYDEMHQNGVNVNFFPKYASKGCMVSKMYSYIIGPSGEIYKCWNDVNHPDKIIGNIQNKEITNKSLFYAYQEATPFEDEKCKNCFAFPICSGGCAWYRYKNMHEGKQFDFCTFLKDKSIIKKCLLKSLKIEKEKPKGAEIRIC